MFSSVVAGSKKGPFESFAEAVLDFVPRVVALIAKGTHRLQTLDTISWIEGEFDGARMLLSLYDVRNFSVQKGVIAEGKVQIPPPAIDPRDVRRLFLTVGVTVAALREEIGCDPVANDTFCGFSEIA